MTKYEKIANELHVLYAQNKIDRKLPTEKEIAKKFDVSINTVRSALELLKKKGYVVSKRGSGYYFIIDADINENAIGIKSLKSLYPSKNITSKILTFDLVRANRLEAQQLNINVNSVIYKIKRIRFIDNNPAIIENTIIPQLLIPDLEIDDLKGSLYNYIQEHTNQKIDYAIKEIGCGYLSSTDVKEIKFNGDTPVLIVKNKGFLNNGIQYEYSINFHLTEYFKIVVR